MGQPLLHGERSRPGARSGRGKANFMIQVNASIYIYRPIQQVFEFISTTENDFQWQYGTLESARVSAGSVGVGASFRSVGHIQGQRFLGTFEITEYEANKRYGFRSLSGPLQSQTLYTLESTHGSTRVSISTRVGATDDFAVQEKQFEKQLKKQLNENLVLLKGILENK